MKQITATHDSDYTAMVLAYVDHSTCFYSSACIAQICLCLQIVIDHMKAFSNHVTSIHFPSPLESQTEYIFLQFSSTRCGLRPCVKLQFLIVWMSTNKSLSLLDEYLNTLYMEKGYKTVNFKFDSPRGI